MHLSTIDDSKACLQLQEAQGTSFIRKSYWRIACSSKRKCVGRKGLMIGWICLQKNSLRKSGISDCYGQAKAGPAGQVDY
jgi:hypothetical protein